MAPGYILTLLVLLAVGRPGARPTDDERAIAARIRMGDRQAFRRFFDESHSDVLQSLLRRGVPAPEAEDVVQSAYLRLWETRAEIDVEKPLRGLLFKVAITRASNAVRDASRRAAPDLVSVANTPAVSTGDPSEAQQLRSALLLAIARLPDRRRVVFEHCFLDGLSHREAAEVLGISPKTVEHQMGHALKAIRAELSAFLE